MIVTTRGAGCDERGRRQADFQPDETLAAYGEIVWFWRRDPGATLLVRPMQQRGQERPLPGESTYKP